MHTEPTGRAPMENQRRRPFRLVPFGLVVAYLSLLAVTFANGMWLIGKDGQLLATDFVSFWSAGKLVLEESPSSVYDWALHKEAAVSSGIAIKGYFSFQYPPSFLLLTPVFALFSYPAAMVLWNAAGISLYLAAIRLISGGWGLTMAALAWPAVLWNTVVGQTGFLTAALLGAGAALVERRPALAGILFGLLTYKPQFGLLIPIALIAGRKWRVVIWAALTTAALTGLSLGLFGVSIWTDFFDSIMRINHAILTTGGTDFSKLQSLYGYMRVLDFSSTAAWLAHGAMVIALGAGLSAIWLSDNVYDVKAAALVVATVLASPYAYIYDLVALAIALAFLARTAFSNRELMVILAAMILIGYGPAEQIATGLLAGLLVLSIVVVRACSGRTASRAADTLGTRVEAA